MELNSKKLERTSRIVYYSISVILCLFLILLSNRIIDDLDTMAVRPEFEQFENKAVVDDLQKQRASIMAEVDDLNVQKSTIEKTMATANENYANEKQSFDNWVQTRKTLGSPDKDQEVIERAKKLDQFYKIEQEWRAQLGTRQTESDKVDVKLQAVQKQINEQSDETQIRYDAELKSYDLKVFLIRLLFVAPILALGIFFFIRYRRHTYWPLFFCVYTFLNLRILYRTGTLPTQLRRLCALCSRHLDVYRSRLLCHKKHQTIHRNAKGRITSFDPRTR